MWKWNYDKRIVEILDNQHARLCELLTYDDDINQKTLPQEEILRQIGNIQDHLLEISKRKAGMEY